MVLLALTLAGPLFAAPTTTEYLGWLDQRRQLWVQEMKRMETHEHGQYRVEYRALSERMAGVRELTQSLKTAKGPEEEKLRQKLILEVGEVEQGLEFLLSETPELAEETPAPPIAPPSPR